MNRTKTRPMLAILLLMLAALALSACSSTPLPPLFIIRSPGAAQPAASAAPTPAPVAEGMAAPAAQPAATEVVAVQPTEAAPVAIVITPTVELTATVAAAAVVKTSDAATASAPITVTAAITPTPAVEAAVAVAPPTATPTRVAPTATPTRVAPTATPTRVAPTATRALPTATRAPARPTATPTPEWPKTLVITADDIEQGAASVPGLQISGLDVQFGNNAMTMRFDSLRYSLVSLRNVTIEGRFVVNNCDVDFVADRITPRNLATGAIPGFINQSLDQQLGAWCVESLTVQPGQLVAKVRPRS